MGRDWVRWELRRVADGTLVYTWLVPEVLGLAVPDLDLRDPWPEGYPDGYEWRRITPDGAEERHAAGQPTVNVLRTTPAIW